MTPFFSFSELINRSAALFWIFSLIRSLGDPSINPVVPSEYKTARIAKISILELKGIIIKIPLNVATISR